VQTEAVYYQFQASAWVKLIASDTNPGLIPLALRTDMQTATDVLKAVTAGRQQYHPAHIKCWAQFDLSSASAVVNQSFGIASVVRTGAGSFTVNFTNTWLNAFYGVVGAAKTVTAGAGILTPVSKTTTSSALQSVRSDTGTAVDSADVTVGFVGALA
jgi:hypothetical protein